MLYSKIVLLALSLSSVIFFGGILFGWASLQLWLIEEGQYVNVCEGHVPKGGCSAQLSQLDMVFNAGSISLSGVTLLVGLYMDYFGEQATAAASGTFVVCGCVLLAFAESDGFDSFIPGYMCLAVGGCFTLLSSFTVSFTIEQKYQAMCVSASSCLFDASAVVFTVFYEVHLAAGTSRRTMFLAWAVLGAVVYLGQIVAWGLVKASQEEGRAEGPAAEGEELALKDHVQGASKVEIAAEEKGMGEFALGTPAQPVLEVVPTVLPMNERTLKEQLCSYDFVVLSAFASIQMLRANMYICMNDQLLDGLGSHDQAKTFSSIFSFVLPTAPLFIPIIDLSFSRFGIANVLQLCTAVGIVYGGLALVPSMYAQLATFLFFVMFRGYVYSSTGVFIAQVFGLATLGRVTGVANTICAIVGLLQYPAQYVTNSLLGGKVLVLDLLLLGLCVPLLPMVARLKSAWDAQKELDPFIASPHLSPALPPTEEYGAMDMGIISSATYSFRNITPTLKPMSGSRPGSLPGTPEGGTMIL